MGYKSYLSVTAKIEHLFLKTKYIFCFKFSIFGWVGGAGFGPRRQAQRGPTPRGPAAKPKGGPAAKPKGPTPKGAAKRARRAPKGLGVAGGGKNHAVPRVATVIR